MKLPDNDYLASSAEGKMLLVSLLMVSLYIGAIIITALIAPETYELLTTVVASHVIIGRVPGITVAFAMGAPFYAAVGLNFYIESLMVMFLYPLFVLSWNKLLDLKALEGWIGKARLNAEKYRPLIEKYGRIGLFVFVWIPFWMTGPFVGSIVGYLMGFRHRVTLTIVLGGTLLATACWGIVLQYLHQWAFSFDPRAPWIIIGLMLLLAFLVYIIRRMFKG